jgi:serine/threonine protein kinase/Flp pilus assembly protein TadD
MIGQRIAHYDIEEILGEGGMGVVYRARDINLDRLVAIKFLRPHLYKNEAEKLRFVHEARAASSLDHPNICTIYEVNTTPTGQTFIAMAYYQGETLRRKLLRGPLPVEEALGYAVDIAQGLAKAHNHRLVHCDIKPDNVAITMDGVAKILDFGLAKRLHDTGQHDGELVSSGTVEYMAPEQISGKPDRRTDLWALGVLIYEMTTGRRPFQGSKQIETLQAIAMAPYAPASELSPELEGLIARALAKNADNRYQRAEEMLAHLHALRHGVQVLPKMAGAPQQRRPNSIAVLPFTNLSGDAEAEYFSDGLADEIIHLLSQVRGTLVVSHTSSFEFKNKNESVKAIGERLNVKTVLEGSVRLIGKKMRITAQLTDAVEGFNLWSQRYDRDLEDIFAIQEDIALSIVSMLKINLKGDAAQPRSRYVGNVEAHSLYLQGRYYWDQRTEAGIRKAGECFQRAIALDAGCAPAYAGLADFFISLGFWGAMAPLEAWPKALHFGLRALQIDGRLPEAEIALAKHALFANLDWSTAEQRLLRAIELEPALSSGHFAYGILLAQLGRFESALLEFRCARELDPLSLPINTGVAWAYYYAGKYDQATEECQKAMNLGPNYFEALACMGLTLIARGRTSEASEWFERAVAASQGSPFASGFLGYSYAINGRHGEARAILDRLEAVAASRYITPVAPALIHVGLGEMDEALTALEKALAAREAFLAYLKVFPPFRPLHSSPRFRSLLNEIANASSSQLLTI